MSSRLIHRVTMFKVQGADNQAQLLAAYDKLAKEQKRHGKPYIAYLCAGRSNREDPRNKGYTLVAHTKFRTMEDMRFYDNECEAHQELKALVKGLGVEAPLTVYFDGTPIVDLTHA
ncbi:hypothetical protein M406DRAFT_331330 [Cryphonectria parasitica EP155]|uniref:Stress-response A/B barrel domain-containing protein n=1 Tax=Cryphonectria parasitica (strain ATCC 38755 / EP155) TaxID=660469 RepID=A0A9P4Y1R3_CRYP1|nr:uncharacterized protein M406DRAFT_331330 [Cryphonectria parasitica EP155]KAF3765016.1 hypothetical protein M406DRAFT_331330 [Cryphonectria parasitica EP155]